MHILLLNRLNQLGSKLWKINRVVVGVCQGEFRTWISIWARPLIKMLGIKDNSHYAIAGISLLVGDWVMNIMLVSADLSEKSVWESSWSYSWKILIHRIHGLTMMEEFSVWGLLWCLIASSPGYVENRNTTHYLIWFRIVKALIACNRWKSFQKLSLFDGQGFLEEEPCSHNEAADIYASVITQLA